MSFFSKFTKPYKKGEMNFERARDAEAAKRFPKAEEYFIKSAEGFDAHFAAKDAAGDEIHTPHLVMAGIAYTRLGRNQDALRVLDAALARKEIPDAFLNAGYAAAKLGDADLARNYWSRYPAWADQRIIANALKEQLSLLAAEAPDLVACCEAIAKAVLAQDIENDRVKRRMDYKKVFPPNRGY